MTTRAGDQPGPVEKAVEADIDGFAAPPGRSYLAESARKLARTIDARGDDEPASALAKAVDTLRQVMNQYMAKQEGPADGDDIGDILSTPDAGGSPVSTALRYPPKPRSANARRGGGKGRKAAG